MFLHFTWLWKASISLCRISYTVIPPKHIGLTYILILAEETRQRRINSGRQWPHVWLIFRCSDAQEGQSIGKSSAKQNIDSVPLLFEPFLTLELRSYLIIISE